MLSTQDPRPQPTKNTQPENSSPADSDFAKWEQVGPSKFAERLEAARRWRERVTDDESRYE